MSERLDADICIIGGGSGGLSVAAGAAQLGARTVLVERGRMGGDCLNFGCVPSKSLIAVAERAHVVRDSLAFGIEPAEPRIDMKAVRHHVRSVIAAIEPHDSVERFEGLGVRVIRAHGRLAGTNEVEAGGIRIRARRLVIATGSSPAIPPIPGLAEVDFLTNETIFDLEELPDHLLVLGAGPVGTELAQAFRRLGAAVTLVDAGPMLAREEPCFRSIVRDSLIRDGVAVRDNVRVERIEAGPAIVLADQPGGEERIGG
ncbi:MAG: FAD-dependent oxidoreductase, partial [Geminicoccaceae bacterium]|nr:FAD-dependent oxidoreductase [Geminicoccaceae bacterium]